MDKILEQRLRLCYPTGLHRDVAVDQTNREAAQRFWEHLQPLLEVHGFYCDRPHLWSGSEHVVEFTVFRLGEPPHWFFSDNRPEKVEALKNSGVPHVALEFNVSTIVPALFINIRETWFNPATYGDNAKGEYDDGLLFKSFLQETDFEPWASLVNDVRDLGRKLKLQEFSAQELKEDVPFITHPIWSDDDDDDTDELSDEEYVAYMKNRPKQYVCCLYDCLFGFV